MFLLDTDFFSQTVKGKPNVSVVRWLDQTRIETTFLSVITLEEMQFGFELLPMGRRRSDLGTWLEHSVQQAFAGRILSVDSIISKECGRLRAFAKKHGHTASLGDALIAATAKINHLKLATLNRKHYLPFDIDLVQL